MKRHLHFFSMIILNFTILAMILLTLPQAQAKQAGNIEIQGSTMDGWLRKVGSNYGLVWNSSTGTVYASSGGIWVGQAFVPSSFHIYRGFLVFNTSVVSTSWTVTGLSLKLFLSIKDCSSDFNLAVQKPSDLHPSLPLAPSDFWQGWYGNEAVATVAASSLVNQTYNTIVLSDLTIFNASITRIVLRSDNDLNQQSPIDDNEKVVFDDADTFGYDYPPVLQVQYEYEDGVAAGGVTDPDWVPLSIPNLPVHVRRVLEWVQRMVQEHEEARGLVGVGLIMVIGGAIIKWDKKKRS